VVVCLREQPAQFDVKVCVTGQHREMLDQVLKVFGVEPDHDLAVMQPGQTLSGTTARIVAALESVLEQERPDLVLVQGDTTTTLCGALAAFYKQIPIGHLEAGLRTGDMTSPFPEEMNRVLTTRLATLHFAATEESAANLRAEGVPDHRIFVTGNSGIDAVMLVKQGLESGRLQSEGLPRLDPRRKLILVTAHRRESFGAGFIEMCRALRRLAGRSDVEIVFPVHPNPHVQAPVWQWLTDLENVHLLSPLEYVSFVDLMRRSYLLLTDSGGVQEEGPSLGKPILVMRNTTERPEAVKAGTVRLVGTQEKRIVEEVEVLLDDAEEYDRRKRVHNPYGNGRTSAQVSELILSFYGKRFFAAKA
jgi:UDP-N-acetylglucosamine 2-epimerase (non-hydrolysing)